METFNPYTDSVIRSWNYAKTKGLLFTKGQYNLTVTHRKIISMVRTKHSTSRTEIMKSDVSGVTVTYGKGSLALGIVILLCGIIVTICAFMFLSPLALGLSLLALGLLLLLIGILVLVNSGSSINVELYIKSHPEPFLSANSITRRRHAKKLKVKVNRTAANEIANQLCAYILNN